MAWKFNIISKTAVFAVILQNFGKMYIFNITRNAIIMTTLCVPLRDYVSTTYCSHPHVLILELIQSKTQNFRARKISAVQRWLKAVSFWNNALQRWWALSFSVLNSADSEKVRADQVWSSADVFQIFWISAEQRWKTSNLWNSAVQLWVSMRLQHGCFVTLSGRRVQVASGHVCRRDGFDFLHTGVLWVI